MPAQSEPYDAPAIVTFALELKAWREAASLNRKQLADALGFADSYVGQIELRKNLPSEEFAEALDTYFKTNGLFERLRQRIIDTRHISILPPGFSEYLEYEAQAASIKNFSPNVVPGLLQTEGYARAILTTNQRPDIVEQLVQERMKRQEILSSAHAYFTIDEAVLSRTVGNSEVMCGQLAYILDLAERQTISIEVVPLSVGYYGGTGLLTLLGLRNGGSVAYTESSGVGVLIEDPVQVLGHAIQYDSMRGHSLSVGESPVLIRKLMEKYRDANPH